MKQHIANYTVIFERELRTGTKSPCYTVFVPRLGIATEADTLEEAQKAAKSLIQFHLESLVEEGEEIPIESKDTLVTRLEAVLPKNVKVSLG